MERPARVRSSGGCPVQHRRHQPELGTRLGDREQGAQGACFCADACMQPRCTPVTALLLPVGCRPGQTSGGVSSPARGTVPSGGRSRRSPHRRLRPGVGLQGEPRPELSLTDCSGRGLGKPWDLRSGCSDPGCKQLTIPAAPCPWAPVSALATGPGTRAGCGRRRSLQKASERDSRQHFYQDTGCKGTSFRGTSGLISHSVRGVPECLLGGKRVCERHSGGRAVQRGWRWGGLLRGPVWDSACQEARGQLHPTLSRSLCGRDPFHGLLLFPFLPPKCR